VTIQLAGFSGKYFNNLEDTAEAEDDDPFLSILSSKTSEETMVNTNNDS